MSGIGDEAQAQLEYAVEHALDDFETRLALLEEDQFDVIDDEVLSVEVDWHRSTFGSSPEVKAVVLILGTGGPHIEAFLASDGESVIVEGYWGSAQERRYHNAPNVAALLSELEDDAANDALSVR